MSILVVGNFVFPRIARRILATLTTGVVVAGTSSPTPHISPLRLGQTVASHLKAKTDEGLSSNPKA